METIYIIHTYFDHCSVDYKGKNYTYHELKEILKKRGKAYVNKYKIKSKPIDIKNSSEKFEKSNLSEKQLKSFYLNKQTDDFRSFLSSQRSLRRKGKLEQHKVDKLNEFGMLWNPKVDNWEILYEKFKNKFVIEIIKDSFNEYGNHWRKLRELNDLETWKEEQRRLYKNDKLGKENLARLNFINFPFDLEPNEKEDISIYKLITLFNYLKELNNELRSRVSRKEFCDKYSVEKKCRYVGAKIKINESIVVLKNKIKGKVKVKSVLNDVKKLEESKISLNKKK